MMAQIGSLFASFWQIFSLPHPILGISFGSIFIGVFVVSLSLRILVPLLGIGNSIYTDVKDAPFRRDRDRKRQVLRDKQRREKRK